MTSIELLLVEPPKAAPTPFDYSTLSDEIGDAMRACASRIHGIRQASVLEVAGGLIAAKGRDAHGCFLAWGRMTQKRTNPPGWRITMRGRKPEPVNAGWGDPAPEHRGRTPKNEERQKDGFPAAPNENVENSLDQNDGTGHRLREKSYPARWLRAHYAISGALAAIIAAEFGWEQA